MSDPHGLSSMDSRIAKLEGRVEVLSERTIALAHQAQSKPEVDRYDALKLRWRVGGQVFRTLYVEDPDEPDRKHPDNLFGMVDTAKLAGHIVELHNWWLDMREAQP